MLQLQRRQSQSHQCMPPSAGPMHGHRPQKQTQWSRTCNQLYQRWLGSMGFLLAEELYRGIITACAVSISLRSCTGSPRHGIRSRSDSESHCYPQRQPERHTHPGTWHCASAWRWCNCLWLNSGCKQPCSGPRAASKACVPTMECAPGAALLSLRCCLVRMYASITDVQPCIPRLQFRASTACLQ